MSTYESNTYVSTPQQEEEEYEVEQILDHRKRAGKLQYEIKWKDYSEEDNTWENESNVFATDLVNAYWDSLGGQAALEAARRGKKIKKTKNVDIKDKGKQSRRASSTSSINKVPSPSPSGVKRTRTPDFSLSLSSESVNSSSLDTATASKLSPKRARTEPVEKESKFENNTDYITTEQQQQRSTIEDSTSISPLPSSSSSSSSSSSPLSQQQQQNTTTASLLSPLSSSSQEQTTTTATLPSLATSKDNQQNLSLSTLPRQKESTFPKSSQTETDTHKENDNEAIQNLETPNSDISLVTTTTERDVDAPDENYEHNDGTIVPSLLEKAVVNEKDTVPCTSPSPPSNSVDTTNVLEAATPTATQEPAMTGFSISISPSERQAISKIAEMKNTTTTTTNEEDEAMDELAEPTSVVSPGTLQDTSMMLDMMNESPFTPTPPPADKPVTAITTDNVIDATTNDTANEDQQDISMLTMTAELLISKENENEDSSTILRDSDKHSNGSVDMEQDPVASKFTRREKYMKGMDEINEDDVIYDDNFPASPDDWVNVKEVVAVTQVPRGSPDSEVFAVVRWENNILSMHPSQDVRKHCPNQLIEFYEKSIKFIV